VRNFKEWYQGGKMQSDRGLPPSPPTSGGGGPMSQHPSHAPVRRRVRVCACVVCGVRVCAVIPPPLACALTRVLCSPDGTAAVDHLQCFPSVLTTPRPLLLVVYDAFNGPCGFCALTCAHGRARSRQPLSTGAAGTHPGPHGHSAWHPARNAPRPTRSPGRSLATTPPARPFSNAP
jgi:hypothetical protein